MCVFLPFHTLSSFPPPSLCVFLLPSIFIPTTLNFLSHTPVLNVVLLLLPQLEEAQSRRQEKLKARQREVLQHIDDELPVVSKNTPTHSNNCFHSAQSRAEAACLDKARLHLISQRKKQLQLSS